MVFLSTSNEILYKTTVGVILMAYILINFKLIITFRWIIYFLICIYCNMFAWSDSSCNIIR